jgi:hypothetical protein
MVALAALAAIVTPVTAKMPCHTPVTVRVDLETGSSTTTARCARYGGSVTVVVENVNTLLYDVTINGQPFRANAALSQRFDRLVPPAVGAGEDPARRAYDTAVHELYSTANELPERLRAILYGSPTPRPERVRREALMAVRAHLEIDDDDLQAVSNAVAAAGTLSLHALETKMRDAMQLDPAGAGASWRAALRDRQAILDRYRAASDMLLQLAATPFEIASAPMVVSTETFRVILSVKARDDLPADLAPAAYEANAREIARLETGGGFTIGASAGMSFSSPVDASYTTVVDGAGDEIITRKGDEDAFTAGIDVMLHAYQRKPGDVNHAIALGLGVNDGGGLQYLLGYGVMLGRSQRVIISAGGIGSEVERLTGGFSQGDVLPPGSSIKTDDEIVLGFYVGATYRFWTPGKR